MFVKFRRIIDTFELKQILKFCVGGGSAVLTDFVVYILLKQYIALSVAKMISFVIGAAIGFLINKLWTFESRNFRLREIFRYALLYAVSATANTMVNKGVLSLSNITIIAFLCATAVSTIINFLGQKFFVFKKV